MHQLLKLTWVQLGRSVSSLAALFAVLPKLEARLAGVMPDGFGRDGKG